MLYYLLYLGIESFPFKGKDFDELLIQARERNELLGITGKLIYCEGTFLQLLEGDETNVKAIYGSIEKDSRLIATKLISDGNAENRYFEEWSMAFEKVPLKTLTEFEGCTHENVGTYLRDAPVVQLLKILANSNLRD